MSTILPSLPIPQNFAYYVNRIKGFSQNTITIYPAGTRTSIPMNTVTTFMFPTVTRLNMRSFRLIFTAVPSTTSGVARLPRYSDSLIRKMVWKLNGMPISGEMCNEYNTLRNIQYKIKSGVEYNRTLSYCAHGAEQLTAATANETEQLLTIDDFSLFPGDCQPSVFDTSFGELTVDITWAGNEVLIGDGTATAGSSFIVNNLKAEIQTIQFADDMLDRMTNYTLSKGGMIEIPYYDVAMNTVLNQGDTTFNIQASSLDKIIVAMRPPEYNTATKTVAANHGTQNGNSAFFKFSPMVDTSAATVDDVATSSNFVSETNTWQFIINGQAVPQNPVPFWRSYDHILNCFDDLSNVYASNLLTKKVDKIITGSDVYVASTSAGSPTLKLLSSSDYLGIPVGDSTVDPVKIFEHYNFMFGINLSCPAIGSESDRMITGLDTKGLNQPIVVRLNIGAGGSNSPSRYVTWVAVVHKTLVFSGSEMAIM